MPNKETHLTLDDCIERIESLGSSVFKRGILAAFRFMGGCDVGDIDPNLFKAFFDLIEKAESLVIEEEGKKGK